MKFQYININILVIRYTCNLKASLNAISEAGSQKPKKKKKEDAKTEGDPDPDGGESKEEKKEEDLEDESPEARVATLTASLATLAAERSRTEAAMQVWYTFLSSLLSPSLLDFRAIIIMK